MIENEHKGWYGSYSLAGKRSAEKYNNIVHKNEILKGETKKIKIHDMFTPDEQKKDILEELLEIIKMYSFDDKILKKHKIAQKKKLKNNDKSKNDNLNFKYFFHNKHCASINKNQKREPEEPGCTRYNPNYNYIWPKLLTGPKWSDVLGRKQKKIEIDNRDFVINNLDNYDKYVINNGDIKCFVNMNKSTQRGDFIDNKDLRIRTDRPFSKTSKSRQKINLAYELTDGAARTYLNGFYRHNNFTEASQKIKIKKKKKYIKNVKEDFLSSNEKRKLNIKRNNKKEISKNNLISDENYQSSYNESMNFKKHKSTKSCFIDSDAATLGTSEQIKYKIKNSAPDFSKLISREQREKIKSYKIENIPFIIPNYSYVRERPIITAIYKKKKKDSKNKKTEFLGIDSTLNYNPISFIEKYNNHLTSNI